MLCINMIQWENCNMKINSDIHGEKAKEDHAKFESQSGFHIHIRRPDNWNGIYVRRLFIPTERNGMFVIVIMCSLCHLTVIEIAYAMVSLYARVYGIYSKVSNSHSTIHTFWKYNFYSRQVCSLLLNGARVYVYGDMRERNKNLHT